MIGTVAVTDEGWYHHLLARPDVKEVNFWRPSARRGFRAPEFSPFFFKLRSPKNAICGFAYFAGYSKLPVWLAWEVFGEGNGVENLEAMQERLDRIRRRIRYKEGESGDLIGCTLLVEPVFFPKEAWIRQPEDWPARTQTDMKYSLEQGEGRRIWDACLTTARTLRVESEFANVGAERRPQYGPPALVRPRLGQGSFRIAVTDAYARACAVTGEHSLPVLDAAHIVPFHEGGEHAVRNGLLLRADLHRLFDRGYLTVTPQLHLEVSSRLRTEFRNGHSYYPLQGRSIRLPRDVKAHPDPEYLLWHNEEVFAA